MLPTALSDMIENSNSRTLPDDILSYICKFPIYMVLKHPGIYAKDLNNQIDADAEYWSISQPTELEVEFNEDIPDTLQKYARTYYVEEGYVAEIRDVNIVGYMPIGIYDGYPIIESFQGEPERFYSHLHNQMKKGEKLFTVIDYLSTQVRDSRIAKYQTVFPLVCVNSYYHWLLEYLPRLQALKKYEESTGRLPKILIAPDAPSWMCEQLDFFGLGDRIIRWNGRKAKVERLITSTHRLHNRDNFNPSKTDWEWLKSKAVGQSTDTTDYSDRVFVSRADADERRITNESELMSELTMLGFKRYTLTEMNFEDQVSLFNNAEIIVGPHGAGLSNIIFGPDNLTLVEIFSNTDIRPHFYRIATILGHDYHCSVEKASGDDIKVNIPSLVEQIQKLTN